MSIAPASRRIDLLAVGSPCVDLVIGARRLPRWDDKALGRSLGVYAGGTESNVACAASRLGWRSAVFGEVGDDPHAQLLIDDFQRHGVSTEHLAQRRDSASAMTTVFVGGGGERAIVYVPMKRRAESAPERRPGFAATLADSRCVYTMPYDAVAFARLSTAARAAGTRVAIDVEREVAGDPATLAALLGGCDVAFFNESGFLSASGRIPSRQALGDMLAAGGPRVIVVSLGARGAIAASADDWAVQPAWPARVIDTTGAGDSFNAAFLVARRRWRSLAACLAFACAAASRTVQAVGARSGLATLQNMATMLGEAADAPADVEAEDSPC
jgi:sugar/nucleoside kinase (ribokinase family)